jgi:hypothetical protein
MKKSIFSILTAAFLSVLLLFSACGSVNSTLAQNRTLWQSQQIRNYSYRLDIGSNFRPPPMGNFVVSVKDGKAGGYNRLDYTSDTTNKQVIKYDTFEKIFDFLEQSYKNDSLQVDATYDAVYGFPTGVNIYELDYPLGFMCKLTISDFTPD